MFNTLCYERCCYCKYLLLIHMSVDWWNIQDADFPGVKSIIKYSINERLDNQIQTSGYARCPGHGKETICLTMVEPWAYNCDLGDDKVFNDGHNCKVDPKISSEFKDPDEPIQPSDRKWSTKQSDASVDGIYIDPACTRLIHIPTACNFITT